MKAASGFHVTADVTTGGQEEKLDIHYGATTASGTVTMAGNAIQLISVAPYVYLKASQDFWKTFVPSASQAQFLPLIEGKWVKAKASSSDFADLASVLDKNSFINNLGSGDPSSKFVNLGLSHVGSTQVVRLRDTADGTVVDILASGTPYPVDALPGKTAGTGGATFSDWNVPYTATAPPASETFDVSALLGG